MSITSPALTVERTTGSTGARIHGVDLDDLDDDTFATIREALLEHGVVHLPGQDVSPEAHKAFGERFGPLHTHPAAPDPPSTAEPPAPSPLARRCSARLSSGLGSTAVKVEMNS